MQTFTGLEMLKIDIANCFGLDKQSWIDRLAWFEFHEENLSDSIDDAEAPLLYTKAIKAYEDACNNVKSNHTMFLDATASGLQIMAALSGCKATASSVNLINTGKREDVYGALVAEMNSKLSKSEHVTRELIKHPLMTHYYNKIKQSTLSESQQAVFYTVLQDSFEGAEAVKDTINDYWNPDALDHTWTLPDGHVAHVKVTTMINARIEVDELDHTTFTYRFEVNEPSKRSSSLVPNIIHSIDAYIVREMIRKSNTEGFLLAHIHDAFCAHPNNMQRVRELYRDTLVSISKSNMLEDILSDISGNKVQLLKFSDDLHLDILNSEYLLS